MYSENVNVSDVIFLYFLDEIIKIYFSFHIPTEMKYTDYILLEIIHLFIYYKYFIKTHRVKQYLIVFSFYFYFSFCIQEFATTYFFSIEQPLSVGKVGIIKARETKEIGASVPGRYQMVSDIVLICPNSETQQHPCIDCVIR